MEILIIHLENVFFSTRRTLGHQRWWTRVQDVRYVRLSSAEIAAGIRQNTNDIRSCRCSHTKCTFYERLFIRKLHSLIKSTMEI